MSDRRTRPRLAVAGAWQPWRRSAPSTTNRQDRSPLPVPAAPARLGAAVSAEFAAPTATILPRRSLTSLSAAWSDPPEDPIPYGIATRALDSLQGWRDGRRNLPRVTLVTKAPPGSGEPDSGEKPVARAPIVPMLPTSVETPWLKAICRLGGGRISEERLRHQREAALLTAWFAAAVTRLGTLARAIQHAGIRLDEAAKPPDPARLGERRLAETDLGARPDALVRARRLSDHDRRFRAAEAAFREIERDFAAALTDVVVLGDLVQRRNAVTRARIQRIHEHTWRRIAVYWQRLVRVHDDGPALNSRIAPLGPKLPSWARDDTDRDLIDDVGSGS